MQMLGGFLNKYIKVNRLTILNIVFAVLLAITPESITDFSIDLTDNPNNFFIDADSKYLLIIGGLLLFIIWIAGFWAARYRVNIIHLRRSRQTKKGVSYICRLGYLHIFASLVLAAVIATLFGAAFNATKILIPVFVIVALFNEPIQIQKIKRQLFYPIDNETKVKNALSDIVLLIYAYLVFLLTWQSFVVSGNMTIDLSQASGLFKIFFAAIIYSVFYIGACWVWFEEMTVNLQIRMQKIYFVIVFLLELFVVVFKLMKI